MPPVTLLGHVCTGHGCWPPRPSVEGEPRFTVGGIPVHLQGHAWASHTCKAIPQTHASVLAAGSPRFFVGGRQLGRIGDPVACGSTVAQGEPRFEVAA
ncbi:PAAR domain-containing protein [Pararhodospirillum photometricum]|uniref:PAAR domain-containing protein n=1 Tax=Pararhodospirillum photometricum TaxID=1084 RepID=UPI0005A22F60|nr:PAAR domain-containing protein [Pararhodospirillum photometricum]